MVSEYVTNDDMDQMTRAIFAPDSDCVHNVQPLNDLVEDIVRREVAKALRESSKHFLQMRGTALGMERAGLGVNGSTIYNLATEHLRQRADTITNGGQS